MIHQLLVQTEINGGSSIACMFTAACLHFSLTHKTIAPFLRIFYLQNAMNSHTRFNHRHFVITKMSLFLVFNLRSLSHIMWAPLKRSLIFKVMPFRLWLHLIISFHSNERKSIVCKWISFISIKNREQPTDQLKTKACVCMWKVAIIFIF